MIDLRQFCSTDSARADLMKPFSRGDHTYASNGHIGVRVPRIADVPEGGQDLEGKFPKTLPVLSPARFAQLKEAPPETERECSNCDGSGSEHGCPDCECECDTCGGTGTETGLRKIIDVSLRGATFDLKYINLIAALPGLMLPLKADEDGAMYFSFAGGDGLLMPRRLTGEAIDAELTQPVDA